MLKTVLNRLHQSIDEEYRQRLPKWGINTLRSLGVRVVDIKKLARELGRNHLLALELWETGVAEARILAAYVADPKKITEETMDQWVLDVNCWHLCDQVCAALFSQTPFAEQKVVEWVEQDEEFVKRAGFVLMVCLTRANQDIQHLLPTFFRCIEHHSCDRRNFVKKGVSWALREIGKRSSQLRQEALLMANQLQQLPNTSARWIARDVRKALSRTAQGSAYSVGSMLEAG